MRRGLERGGILTEDADTVVEGDDDDISVAGQDASVDHVARALHVGSSVDVNHDRLGPRVSYVCKSGHH